MSYFLVGAGLVLLFVGGEALVRGAVVLARALGVSPLFVGVVIVGFGTSAPEFVVSVEAALVNKPDIAVGNIVGSNIANLLLILGVAAVIYPMPARFNQIWREALAVLFGALLLIPLGYMGIIVFWQGIVMLALLTAFLVYTYCRQSRQPMAEEELLDEMRLPSKSTAANLGVGTVVSAAGIATLVLGSNLLIEGAIDIAMQFGISEAVVGLSLVAVGTSLPELATSIVAAIRRHSDVALGNVLGSNIFNVFAILGAASLITPIPFSPEIAQVDVWICIASTLLVGVLILSEKRLSRSEGSLLLAAYAGYIIYLYS
ncbi:calcium/sodium antiporter [Limibacillus halophilus]|uniref:Cation:H+ antiporter n=1 Tax=Limibacillus halophilus TaxID=1579333 RepID=A0A839STB4_9PROT|nr:calcium/sodium antiporter [Limibacillus halophilus]MBB3066041.1 cation:H+ antiporter [Limibacillus halophilus]